MYASQSKVECFGTKYLLQHKRTGLNTRKKNGKEKQGELVVVVKTKREKREKSQVRRDTVSSRRKTKKKTKNIMAPIDKKCFTSVLYRIDYCMDNANDNNSDDIASITSQGTTI